MLLPTAFATACCAASARFAAPSGMAAPIASRAWLEATRAASRTRTRDSTSSGPVSLTIWLLAASASFAASVSARIGSSMPPMLVVMPSSRACSAVC